MDFEAKHFVERSSFLQLEMDHVAARRPVGSLVAVGRLVAVGSLVALAIENWAGRKAVRQWEHNYWIESEHTSSKSELHHKMHLIDQRCRLG